MGNTLKALLINFSIQQNFFQVTVTEAQRSFSARMQPQIDKIPSTGRRVTTMESVSGRRAIPPEDFRGRERTMRMSLTTTQTPDEDDKETHQGLEDTNPEDGDERLQDFQALILSPLHHEELDEDPNDPDTAEIMEIERNINDTLDQTFDDTA
jgi:hypothetical protein